MKSIKAIFRRGQPSTKIDGQIHTPEDLSRSSSVTNLNLDQASPKTKSGAGKPRKSSSRDKLDKLVSGTGTTERKNDRKGINKNNNKFEPGDQSLTLDSLQEIDSLKTQLHQMATEKSSLALKLGEQKGQIHSLQHQIENLKMYQEQSSLQLEQLTEENTALRNRLRDVAHSPLSDNEKQQLLYESHRHHNSAPASIATNPMEDGTCGDVTACPTPDWDKHSSSNVSDVSVACLQDKINQMQETHYSTNEELQATLQELTDLQRQLTELQQENERLVEEKSLMFDSLCRQTERLKDTRQEVESLKTVIYREQNETGVECAQEREEKLVDLLKSAQDEHESLLSKHEQLSGELQELRETNEALDEQLKVLSDRNGTLESTLDAKHAEQKLLDQELAQARDQCNGKQIEINRLKDLLENARTKINELEQDRALSDKSELDELLDNARKEKDALESEVTHLKEQLARSKNEIEKLREQISILQEECKVTRNNARTIQSDLEYKYEKLASEKAALTEQLHKFQDIINELQVQAQCQEEDKRNLSDVLAETQRNLSESERKIAMLENELTDVKKLRKEENEEWEKFQNDLLTSVRVANDFKTEAQQDLQKMIMENKEHRDKVRQLEAQLDKLKGDPAMPADRRNSQPYSKQNVPRRIFGSLPNLLDNFSDKEHTAKSPKRPKWLRHQKQLSQGEEKILESLHTMYEQIDPEKPDDMLTSEQALIKKLKTLYEDDSTAYKPVAPRKKHDLAISKPLLESVYSNPKLESIAKNPNLRSLEHDRYSWMGHKRFSDDQVEVSPKVNMETSFKPSATNRFVSYIPNASPEVSPRISSTKLEDRRFSSMESTKPFPLRRYSSKEDLTGIAELESFKPSTTRAQGKRSSLKSHHSDSSSNISQKKRVSFDEHRNSCLVIKEFLSFESLENIYQNIDPKTPEDKLTKEQRFALRLKTSMENLGEKPELRKRPTFKKSKVTISSPLKESVLRNTKLCSIIKDPVIRTAGTDSEQEMVELRKVHRMKKYLGDINRVLRNPSRRMCKRDSRLSRSLEDLNFPYVFKRISSSMENLPSEGGIEPKIEIKVVTKVLPAKCFAASLNVSSSSSSVDNSVENLTDSNQNTPVVFIEHFEPEEECTGVQIKDISEERNNRKSVFEDDEYTGRISFPEEEEDVEVCRMRLLSINSVEMEEDDVLARYKQISEFKEAESDRESFAPNPFAEDCQSFYSVELTNSEDKPTPKLEAETPLQKEEEEKKEEWFCYDEDKTTAKLKAETPLQKEEKKEEWSCNDEDKTTAKLEAEAPLQKEEEEEKEGWLDEYFDQSCHDEDKSTAELEADASLQKEEEQEKEHWLDKYLDQSCDDEDKKDNRKMRVLYKDVVKEIKRKYSQDVQSSSDSSDEENVHIFNTTDGKVEVRRMSEEDVETNEDSNFFDNFFKTKRYLPFLKDNENKDSSQLNTNMEGGENMVQSSVNPSEEEIEYIRNVQETFKEEFEDLYRLGNTDVESDYKKILLRQDAIDCSFKNSEASRYLVGKQTSEETLSDKTAETVEPESEVLSNYEMKLLSSVKKRHSRPLSDINMDDLVFIESMRNKYLSQENDETSRYSTSSAHSTSYSSYYLKDSTENFLANEKRCDMSESERQYDIKSFGSFSHEDINYATNDFLKKEREYSEQHQEIDDAIPLLRCEKEKENSSETSHSETSSKSFSHNYLIHATSNFLIEEVNHNTYFKLSDTTKSTNDEKLAECSVRKSLEDLSHLSPGRSSVKYSRSGLASQTKDIEFQKEPKIQPKSASTAKNPTTTEFISKTNLILRNSKEISPFDYEPVYTNTQNILYRNVTSTPQGNPRKPKPLPRKTSRLNVTTVEVNSSSTTSMTRTLDNVTVVNVTNVPHKELLPNSSKVMDKSKDVVKTLPRTCMVPQGNPEFSSEKSSNDSLATPKNLDGSSNILVRKTKKFIKDGDQVEEFDEATGVYNLQVDNMLEDNKFNADNQVIPDHLIDYADSESKITLFDIDNTKLSDFQECCSRPQTSQHRTTAPFRLSYYGENSEEGVQEATPRTSKENVNRLKQKFENMLSEDDETKKNSEKLRNQKSNLAKFLNEKTAYDLVFKTESKYWFDNISEADSTVQSVSPSFETSSSEKPLNITILDPIESKTNANYQHLFESGALNRPLQKPFAGNVNLSELNLKTSIPCVDFTTVKEKMTEHGSNVSLYHFGLGDEHGSPTDVATCTSRKK